MLVSDVTNALVPWGHHDKTPPTGHVKQQRSMVSEFWRPEIRSRCQQVGPFRGCVGGCVGFSCSFSGLSHSLAVDDILYEPLYTCPLCLSVRVSKCDLLLRSCWIRAHPHDLTLTASSAKTLFPKKPRSQVLGAGPQHLSGAQFSPQRSAMTSPPSPGRRKGWADGAALLLAGSGTKTCVPLIWIMDLPQGRKVNICKTSFWKLLCLKILLDHCLCFCPRAETNGPRCSEPGRGWGEFGCRSRTARDFHLRK